MQNPGDGNAKYGFEDAGYAVGGVGYGFDAAYPFGTEYPFGDSSFGHLSDQKQQHINREGSQYEYPPWNMQLNSGSYIGLDPTYAQV